MNPKKVQIYASLERMAEENRAAQEKLTKAASLADYRSLVKPGMQDETPVSVWSDAGRKSLTGRTLHGQRHDRLCEVRKGRMICPHPF